MKLLQTSFAWFVEYIFSQTWHKVNLFKEKRDALLALENWRTANPELYIGDVEYARNLIFRCIEAHFKILEISINYHDNTLTLMCALLAEHGPEPPRKHLFSGHAKRGHFNFNYKKLENKKTTSL